MAEKIQNSQQRTLPGSVPDTPEHSVKMFCSVYVRQQQQQKKVINIISYIAAVFNADVFLTHRCNRNVTSKFFSAVKKFYCAPLLIEDTSYRECQILVKNQMSKRNRMLLDLSGPLLIC